MKTLLRYTALALALAASGGVASAIPMLRISDGISTVTIADSGVGDNSLATGAVTWIGSVGFWSVNVTGTTKPILGYGDLPIMNLGFVTTSSGAGTLTLSFTETDFTVPIASWTSLILTGTTAGSVAYNVYGFALGPTANTPFDTTRLLDTIGPGSTYFSSRTPSSLTQVVSITHAAPGISSGNAYLRIPDSGTSIFLLGGGLACIGLMCRIRRKSA